MIIYLSFLKTVQSNISAWSLKNNKLKNCSVVKILENHFDQGMKWRNCLRSFSSKLNLKDFGCLMVLSNILANLSSPFYFLKNFALTVQHLMNFVSVKHARSQGLGERVFLIKTLAIFKNTLKKISKNLNKKSQFFFKKSSAYVPEDKVWFSRSLAFSTKLKLVYFLVLTFQQLFLNH